MNHIISLLSYLSGNTLTATILFISISCNDISSPLPYVFITIPHVVSILYLLTTYTSAYLFKQSIDYKYTSISNGNGGTISTISQLKIKNVFSNGAMSYYIFPFISFAVTNNNDTLKNELVLLVLVVVLGIIYVKERQVIYTPVLSLFNYHAISATLIKNNVKTDQTIVIITRLPSMVLLGNNTEYMIKYIHLTDSEYIGEIITETSAISSTTDA